MAIEAPISRQTKSWLLLWMAALAGFGLWCLYDGLFNRAFIDQHTTGGQPDGALLFNWYAPPLLFLLAAGLGGRLVLIRNRKVVAAEKDLVVNDKIHIPYERIDQIDKTYYETKGYFILTYKDDRGQARTLRLNGRDYDRMGPVLDHLVDQLTQSG